jgi:hypothetical protein
VSKVVGLESALNLDHYTAILQNATNGRTPESNARKDGFNLKEIKGQPRTPETRSVGQDGSQDRHQSREDGCPHSRMGFMVKKKKYSLQRDNGGLSRKGE